MTTKRQNNKVLDVVTDVVNAETIVDNQAEEVIEEVVEVNLQDEIGKEVADLKNIIVEYQSKIKEAKKRINDLTKKPGEKSAKSKIIEWYVKQESCTYLEFVNYAVGVEGISGIYCNTLWKQVSK